MTKLSVIIPVYNTEKYLRECLDSIINQSLKDIEIICVDDGSTDNSLKILNDYSSKYPFIKVLTQKNMFAGTARNNGYSVATGEYLHFMDADDKLFDGSYESLIKICEQENYPNIIRFKAHAFDDSTGEYIERKYYEMTDLDDKLNCYLNIDNDLETIFQLSVTPWQGIIKRDFILKNGLMFNDLRCCNDRSFFISSILKSHEIYVSDIICVNHRVNNTSSLVGIRSKNFDCQCKSLEIIIEFCKTNNIEKSIFQKVVLNELSDTFTFYNRFFYLPNSYKNYKILSEFVKKIDKDLLSEDIKNQWYYFNYLELLELTPRYELIRYFIKKYIFNILNANQEYLRCRLFKFIKIKIKREFYEKFVKSFKLGRT